MLAQHPLLHAALAWAARGFRVFPLAPGGKRPVIREFQYEATTNPDVIVGWWTGTRETLRGFQTNYNIGVCTTDMVVVDVDNKDGRNGDATYREFGGDYNTLVVRTPTGGYHCYYAGPDSKLSANKLGRGLDIRSHHGYAVAPGSVTADGEYAVVVDTGVAYVPPLIHAHLEPPGAPRKQQETGVEYDTETAVANAIEWLKYSAELAIEGQGGDNTTYMVCAKLVRDYALTDTTAAEILLEHWNDRCIPPWDADELFGKVENASAYATGALGASRPDATFGVVRLPPPVEPDWTEQPAGVHRGNALAPDALRPRPWLVKGLLLRGEASAIIGAGAAGKSTLTVCVLAHFAAGLDYGGWKLPQPGVPLVSVIYNAEDDLQEQSRKLYAVCQEYMLDYNEVAHNLVFITKDQKPDLLVASLEGNNVKLNLPDIQFMVDTISEAKADIFSVDPLTNVHACNENDPIHMRTLMGIFNNIARVTETSSIVFHHTNKASKDNAAGDANSARGSGGIVNSVRNAFTLTSASERDMQEMRLNPKTAKSYVRLDSAKVNYLKSGEANSWFRWQDVKIVTGEIIGVLKPWEQVIVAQEADQSLAVMMVDILRANDTSIMSVAAMRKELQATDPLWNKMQPKTLDRHIDKAVNGATGFAVGHDVIKCEMDTVDSRRQMTLKLA